MSEGWGQQPTPEGGGWGTPDHQAQRQDAPAPGPVPVRPMRLGELLDSAFKLLRADFWPMILAVGAVVVPTQILVIILGASFGASVFEGLEANPQSLDDLLSAIGADAVGFALGTLLVGVLSVVLALLAEGAVIRIGAARYLGGSEGAGPALGQAGRRAGALIGGRVLATLGALLPALVGFGLAAAAGAAGQNVVAGILGLAGVLCGVYLYVRWVLSPAAVMLEDAGAVASLRRSAQLVRGRWWKVFGYLVVAAIVVTIVGFAVGGVFSALGGAFPDAWFGVVLTGVGSILTGLITEPITALVTFLLYADARVRKEGLDLQIQALGGEPWPESPSGAGPAQWTPGAPQG